MSRQLGREAMKGEPLARETATKNCRDNSLLAPERFFSSLVFDTVATVLYQRGRAGVRRGTHCFWK